MVILEGSHFGPIRTDCGSGCQKVATPDVHVQGQGAVTVTYLCRCRLLCIGTQEEDPDEQTLAGWVATGTCSKLDPRSPARTWIRTMRIRSERVRRCYSTCHLGVTTSACKNRGWTPWCASSDE